MTEKVSLTIHLMIYLLINRIEKKITIKNSSLVEERRSSLKFFHGVTLDLLRCIMFQIH